MMSPFLPDLQLFSLMLCCLGGPLWGNLPCVPPPPQASIVPCCKYLGPWRDGGAGQGNNGWVGVGMGVTLAYQQSWAFI